MIDTMVGLLEICAKSSFYGSPNKAEAIQNFLRNGWRIRTND